MRTNTYYLVLGVVIGVVAMWVTALVTGVLPADAGTFVDVDMSNVETYPSTDGPWYTVGLMPNVLLLIFVIAPAAIIYVFVAQYVGIRRGKT